ncbi:cytidine deaminase [Enterococcus phage BC611]|uniref:Cytidine deaminase n=1 Tax=Enterococcus phage BC611 TaxID=1173135 RepID=I4DSM5_9CAUD|nr:cytidine deaminase [Enterococcus phage BC611]BAM20915.1 cytidine deaminase [Enterococcus phage BC611]
MKFKVGDLVTIREDLKEGKYGADSVVEDMLKYCGKSFIVASVTENGKIDLDGVPWNWTPEMLVDKPSGKIIGYCCLDTGGRDSWWTAGKVYKVYKKQGQEFIIDDERDERFSAAQSLETAIKHQKDYYGTVFEPVYAETSDEDLIKRIKKDIERLNKDQENLIGKRDRINDQIIQLGSKSRKLKEVLEVLEKYE